MNRVFFNIVRCILIIIFFAGVLELIGISISISHLVVNFLTLILFGVSFFIRKNTFQLPASKYFFLLLVIIFISFILNSGKLIFLLFFTKHFILPILFFYALVNIKFTNNQRRKLFRLLKILFIIQIPSAFIKLYFVGMQERIIGTISYLGGSISTILPLIAISYLLPLYIHYKRNTYLLYIVLFFATALIGAKVAIFYYAPILFIFAYLVIIRDKIHTSFIKLFGRAFMTTLLILIIGFFFIKLNPRMNPERKIWGSLDLSFVSNQFVDYNSKTTTYGNDSQGHGRFVAYPIVFKLMLDKDLPFFLFGDGPGALIKTEMFGQTDALLEKYNLGYGGRVGLFFLLLQIGFLGVISYIFFILKLFKSAKILSSANNQYSFNITLLLLLVIFCLDFFTHSTVLIQEASMTYTFYLLIYFGFSQRRSFDISNVNRNTKS